MLPFLLLTAAMGAPPPLDQVAWLDTLIARRPTLMMQHVGTTSDPAWQALVIRPALRERLVGSATETYQTLVTAEYTEAQKVSDRVWSTAMQAARFPPTPTLTWNSNAGDVGFRVGAAGSLGLDQGYAPKVFFEFIDFDTALTPERVWGFAQRLEQVGFTGASKFTIPAEVLRFQYNNLIVYAPTIALGQCAEATGLEWFAGEIAHIGRGVDGELYGRSVDWHHFLLGGGFATLPEPFQDYVKYRTPNPAKMCPSV